MKKKNMASKFLKVTAATSIALTSLSGVPFNVLANEVPVISQMATGVSVDVSTWAEFKAALESSTVTDVNLTANILMGSDVSINGSSKTIQGNGHTIDANSMKMLITANGNSVKISNTVITRTSSDGIVYSTNSGSLQANVTLDNVTSSGSRLFILGNANLFLENNITDTSTFNYSGSAGSISADSITLQNKANVSIKTTGSETFALKAGTNMKVSSDSKLAINGAGSDMQLLPGGVLNVDGTMELSANKYNGIQLEDAARLRVNEGGKLIGNKGPRSIIYGVKSNTIENAGEILINTNNTAVDFVGANSNFINSGTFEATTTASGSNSFVVMAGAKLQLKPGSHFTMKTINTLGWATLLAQDIEVEDRATLDMDVKSTESALVSKNTTNLKSGSNISISNSAGRALGGNPSAKVQLDSETGISTWLRGNVSSLEPTRSYAGPLNMYVELVGVGTSQTQKNIQSNNIDATLFYINKDIGKIASGSFVKDTKQIEFENAAREAVNGLFTSKDPKNDIKTGLTQADIDAAQALINKVTDPTKKAELQADLNKAQSQLDAKTAQAEAEAQNKAREAVNNLFTNKNPNGTITGTMTQADIDAAQALINKVTDPTKKAELQADLNKAQNQLDTKAAQAEAENKAREAVNNLFTNKDPNGNITNTMTQADIDAAQTLINKVTDPTKKAALQADLNKAQSQLDAKKAQAEAENKAREAVNNLFTNKNPNGTITGTMTQADIDAAQALINKVTDPTKKAALQADLNKAQSQLDAKTTQTEAENKAREAVNNLFTNKDPNGNITNTMTQADIDAAQPLINKVTDPTKKAELQTDLNKAQSQLDAKKAQAEAENKAREAVNNLFTNKNPNGNITGTMTQADIDAAQALINKVTDPTKKAALQADLNKAQSQLDAKTAQVEAENKAREAVNNLFTNKDPNGNITGTMTQADIDAAQALINKVTDPTKKAALQKDLDKAKAQFASNGTLKPDDFVLGTTTITGSYSGDVDRITLSKDGVESGNATKTNGTFRFYVGPGIKKDQSLYMVAYDKNGREIAREKVNIAAVTAGQITPTAMTIPGDANITGTYTGDVSRIEVSITNEAGTTQVYKGGTVGNGTFKFYSFDKTKSPKDIIVVRAYDSVGKLLDTKTVTIKNNVVTTAGQVTPATLTIPGNTSLTGTVSGDVAIIKVTVNGTVYAGGSIASDGTFRFYTFDKIKKADDTVTIAVYDKAGKLLDTKPVTIQAPTR
ncbi:hypothetical protein HCA99_11265 [Listeria booriae]|uniref:toxin Cry1Ac domain D-VI-related protein n=1 Tax=Listeria booriae TaxID=1552123 RepID=UPI00162AB76C|nr:toxin Cry1Ac domain D-VI-related protein [Listeria booriae]MBC2079794.1 hypothetical protein [Listeria booriae]